MTAERSPEVAVFVCAYQAGAHLLPCVRSLLAQTLPDIEVLVMDDGSTDGSSSSLDSLDDARLRVVRLPENRGKAACLNLAMAESAAPFVAMQDADDLSHPERLARQLRHLQEHPDLAGVFCGNDLLLGTRVLAPRLRAQTRAECRRAIARMTLPALDPTAMYRRSLIEEFEHDEELRIAQGLDFILRVGELHPLEVLPDCLYTYRVTRNSGTKRDAELRREYVDRVCRAACRRRGLSEDDARHFVQDTRSLGPHRVLDNNLAAHFMESALDLRAARRRGEAVATGLQCARLHPFDAHYYKALVYSVLPLSLVGRLRRTVSRARVAPLPAPPGAPSSSQLFVTEGTEDRRVETPRPLRIVLFGAAGDTGNHGVSALMHSALGGIVRHAPASQVTVFDNGWGVRPAEALLGGRTFSYARCGARLSRRYHRPESYANMNMCATFGGLGNPGVRRMLDADAIWDVSGGDSFADLYGARHLDAICAPKKLALRLGKPLVLLPQTYGPFSSPAARALAQRIVRGATLAWARDERSFEALKDLLGDAFDARRHRSGVDMAFALESYEPRLPLPLELRDWLTSGASPVVGVNVSGLLWNDPRAAERFGLSTDYQAAMVGLVRRFLDETDVRVVLVPHVVPTAVLVESDADAGDSLAARFSGADAGRIACAPSHLDQSETKWLIARLDWFTGPRMHATIAALSSHVPTGGLAYSRKMQGVFETCGVGDHVVDLRSASTEVALAELWRSWEERDRTRKRLRDALPAVVGRATEELFETLEVTAALVRNP